ncbi:MAG: peptidyl-prolyl cis-trans isomerase [Azospirillaceae bacterium]|nr:peptidyl-prolyl cis-trans isomerase [Azospirillaceae bacterium]
MDDFSLVVPAVPVARARRSLRLFAAGAVAGLALAAASLFTGPEAGDRQALPAGGVARVNGVAIGRDSYEKLLRNLYNVAPADAAPAQRKDTLRRLIDEELLVQRGLEVGLPTTELAVREAIVTAVIDNIDADVLAEQPDDAKLRPFFEANRSRFVDPGTFSVRDLRVPAGAGTADRAARGLAAGEPLTEMVARLGLVPATLVPDTPLTDLTAGATLSPDALAALTRLSPGQAIAVTADDGEHLLVLTARETSAVPDFAAVRDRVARDYLRVKVDRAQTDYLAFLRGRAEIAVAAGIEP